MQKAGQLAADGSPVRERRDPGARIKESRTSPMQFLREVRSEMKKVGWPTRAETLRLSLIVFIAILVLGTFIFLVDLAFGNVTDFLFPSPTTQNAAAAVSMFF